MRTLRFHGLLLGFAAAIFFAPRSALCAVPNSLILNETNTVSGSKFLDKGHPDTAFGRVEGNGQNWFEFLAVQGDPLPGGGFKNTLDVRGWTIDWSYNKDNANVQYGSGTITFSQDPLWATVPRGTMLTVSEWQDAWYLTNTPAGYDPFNAGGLERVGGINGLGHLRGTAYDANADTKLGATPGNADPQLLATNTYWNPAAGGGGANGDWNMHVYAGERNPDNSFKYFDFSGSITDSSGTYAIGTDDGGLFAANNDNWQYTIKDVQGNVIQGPIGEQGTGIPGSTFGVNSTEILRLEGRFNGNQPQSTYLDTGIADYADGSESTFGSANVWSSGAGHQGLDGLRSWLQLGDANLDGAVNAADYVIWRANAGSSGGWMQGDFSGDGIIDTADYDIWRSNFGATSASGSALGAATVPEPGPFGLLTVFGLAAAIRRSRKSAKR